MKTANMVEMLRLVTVLPLIIVLVALASGIQSGTDSRVVYAAPEVAEARLQTDSTW